MKNWIVLLSAMGLAAPAAADLAKGSQTMVLHFGAHGYGGDKEVEIDNGDLKLDCPGGAGLEYTYFFRENPWLGLGVNAGGYLDEEEGPTQFIAGNGTAQQNTGIYMTTLRMQYPRGRWRPYIMGGLGVHRTHLTSDVTPNAGVLWPDTNTSETRRTFDSVNTGFAGALGVGLDVYFRDRFFLGLEYRDTVRTKRRHEPTGVSPIALASASEPTELTGLYLRLGWRFGGKRG
jgi:opacity protein-like surface antigen